MTDNRAFYYINGEPCNGLWVDLDPLDDTDEVLEILAEARIIPRNEDGEPDYGGDLLVADTEGDLAECFLSSYGMFDLAGFVEVRDFCIDQHTDESAAVAYIGWMGEWNRAHFEETYCGKHDSERDYTEQLIDDTGMLSEMPENLRGYFDYEAYSRDLFISDYHFADGHVFRNT